MRFRRHLLGGLLLLPPVVAHAEEPADPQLSSAVWIAGLQGGVVHRDGGKQSPYAAYSVTRFAGTSYLRGAVTVYRSTVEQADAALPSTYVIGSLGAGGNFRDWVVDAHVSYGRQDYGLIETAFGKRRSTIAGSDYFAAGLRVGRVFRPAPRWYLTPTVSVQYVDTRSLRYGFDATGPIDFEIPERAWIGSPALRLDRTFGPGEQNFVGLSVSHSISDNGLTQLSFALPAVSPQALRTPDQWQEVAGSATLQLTKRLWLDGQVQRSFGATAGDSTVGSLTVRMRF